MRPASQIYMVLSSFDNFTPILADKVEGWSADDQSCRFKVKGFEIGLKMVERTPHECIKVTGDGTAPMPFTFWLQMKEVEGEMADTRMRLVLHVELNMMMKMMIGGRLQEAIDTMADKIAESFNNAPY